VVTGQGIFIDPPADTALTDTGLATFSDSYLFSHASHANTPPTGFELDPGNLSRYPSSNLAPRARQG
jgi:hypothetical protein